jgi:hypothetical protein
VGAVDSRQLTVDSPEKSGTSIDGPERLGIFDLKVEGEERKPVASGKDGGVHPPITWMNVKTKGIENGQFVSG